MEGGDSKIVNAQIFVLSRYLHSDPLSVALIRAWCKPQEKGSSLNVRLFFLIRFASHREEDRSKVRQLRRGRREVCAESFL